MKLEKVKKYIGEDKLLLVKFRNGLTLKGQFLHTDSEKQAIEFKTLAKTAWVNVLYIENVEIIIENFSPNMFIEGGKPDAKKN